MWSQEVQGISRFDDLPINQNRIPLVKNLEAALLNAQPSNTLYFIKQWAQKQMKDLQSSDDEYLEPSVLSKRGRRNKQKQGLIIRRRNAIVMAKVEQNQQRVVKNEECKSKIMLSLKKIPFLVNLGWQQINQIIDAAAVKEYQKDDVFARKGQPISQLYILIQGSIAKEDKGIKVIIDQGSAVFMESVISLTQANHNYFINSHTALICGIQAFLVYQLLQKVNRDKEEQYQRILMGVNIFHTLDKEQFYKLIGMVKLLPIKRANQVVVEKSEPIDRLFLVLRGQFLLCKKNLSNEIISFLNYKEGQVFGQAWVINPTEAQFSVISKTQGLLGFISRQKIQQGISPINRLLLRKKNRGLQQKQ